MEYGSNVSDNPDTYGTILKDDVEKRRKMDDLFIQPPFPPANHPSKSNDLKKSGNKQYKTEGVEPFDLLRDGNMFWHFGLGNIIKYAFRLRHQKFGQSSHEDLLKIVHYAEMLIEDGSRRG